MDAFPLFLKDVFTLDGNRVAWCVAHPTSGEHAPDSAFKGSSCLSNAALHAGEVAAGPDTTRGAHACHDATRHPVTAGQHDLEFVGILFRQHQYCSTRGAAADSACL